MSGLGKLNESLTKILRKREKQFNAARMLYVHRALEKKIAQTDQNGLVDVDMDSAKTELDEREKAKLWKGGIRLPFYSTAFIPVLVGSAAAFHNFGILLPMKMIELMIGGAAIITWLNLTNDLCDSETGADIAKPESLVNLTQNKALLSNISIVFLVSGLILIGHVVYQSHSFTPAWMLLTSILCGHIYQAPPFRLSYKGFGEPLCFVAFGPLATNAFYLLMAKSISSSSSDVLLTPLCWAASTLVGWTTTIILFCSHFHQCQTDQAVEKLSPVVQLGGPHKAFKVLVGASSLLFALSFVFVFMGWLPKLLIPLNVIPAILAVRCIQYGKKNLDDLSKLKFLKLFAIDVHVSLGVALALTFFFSKTIISA